MCGSSTETFLTELLHTSPTQLKVQREWGDIVAGGKQIAVSGTTQAAHAGPGDLPTTHVYGDDLSMDIALDQPYLPYARSLGPAERPANTQHVEIASGLIPHQPRPSQAAPGQTWRQLSDFNLAGFQPGFDHPAPGDRTLVMGRWIIDCGHESYATELHPISFLAWSQQVAGATVARTYFNPYRDTELFSADTALLGKANDAARASQPGVTTFPPYLIADALRVATGAADHLQSQELIEATRASIPQWTVCAPAGSSGRTLRIDYDLVARPGVTLKVAAAAGGSACATVTATLTNSYRALDAHERECVLPWSYISQQVVDQPSIDVKALIQQNVPAAVRSRFDKDPGTSCADALAGPVIDTRPSGQHVRVDATQPFPFYGVIAVRLG